MNGGTEEVRPHLHQSAGGESGETVSRRRGRPPTQVGIAVSYRPRDPKEDKQFIDAVRMLVASMVRERMATTEEVET